MKRTQTQQTSTLRVERIRIRVTCQEKEQLRAHASSLGLNISSYIRALIAQDVKEGIVCQD